MKYWSTGTQYTYGPFGEVIRATGPMAKPNPFRFSTKYQDDETDLLYYPHRYLNISMGRWLNRDPLDEPGFDLTEQNTMTASSDSSSMDDGGGDLNLYSFVNNGPIIFIDGDGLETMTILSSTVLPCGGWANSWIIDPQISKGTIWVVQQVRVATDITDCNPAKKDTTYPVAQWWEALKLTGGSQYTDQDVFGGKPSAFGRAQIDVASAIYIDSRKLRNEITKWHWDGPAQYTMRGMYQTSSPPSWWGSGSAGTASRSSWSTWSCYCDSFNNVDYSPH